MGYVSIGGSSGGSPDVWSSSGETFSLTSETFGEEAALRASSSAASLTQALPSVPSFTETIQLSFLGEVWSGRNINSFSEETEEWGLWY